MAGFWELPAPEMLPGFVAGPVLGRIRHSITHHRFDLAIVGGEVPRAPRGFRWFSPKEMGRIPLSATARKALPAILPGL
jgi:hypothetical protein